MIDLKKYYDFFSKVHFGRLADITFFNDGSFAVTHEGLLHIFDENCVLLKSYTDVFLCKSTGVIIKIEDGVGFKAYYKGNEIASYKENSCLRSVCHAHNNGFYLGVNCKGKYETIVFNVKTNGDIMVQKVPYSITSNTRLMVDDYGNIVVSLPNKNKSFWYNENEVVELDNVVGIKFLRNHRAIIFTPNGSNLVKYDTPSSLKSPITLLHSDSQSGIRAMKGGFTVIYQDALVADADNGMFICQYNKEKFVSPVCTKVKDYTIEYRDLNAFWVGGNFNIFEVNEEILFVNLYDGRFYPFFIDLNFLDEYINRETVDGVYELKLYQMVDPLP